mgnify:CR=1 FL=1|jgi:hypothetical protein
MRIDEDKIFGAYMDSLLVEKKKLSAAQENFLGKGKAKKSDKDSDDKDFKGKKDPKKAKKLPPWLKGKGKKMDESVVVEHHDGVLSDNILNMTVSELLDNLHTQNLELYGVLESYLEDMDSVHITDN